MNEVNYYIDGTNLSTLGLRVAGSKGVIDAPKIKKPYSVNVDYLHGEYVDLSEIRYEPKQITLECFIKASSNVNLVTKLNSLKELLLTAGLKRLLIQIDEQRGYPLLYDVYCKEGIEITKRWRESGEVVGSFPIKLVEPEPYKQVLQFTGSSLQLNLNNTFVNISWGDGTYSRGISNMFAPHTYAQSGTYYPIITGTDIRNLNILSYGGATVLWETLL